MGDRSPEVDANLDTFKSEHRDIARRLRAILHDLIPGVVEAVKWNQPTFVVDGTNLFYVAAAKNHVKFGLMEGAHLPDPQGIVEGTGKNMRHVKIADADALDEDAIRALISAACQRVRSSA